MKKPASSYYRRHFERTPKEDPIHTFGAWRQYVAQTNNTIGYEAWLGKMKESSNEHTN